MTAILFLIPISIGLGLCGLFGFIWSIRSGQYDNISSDAHRALNSEDRPLGALESQILRSQNNQE